MVVKMSSPGRSFGGVADYCLHDPRLPGEAQASRERGAGGVDGDPQPGDGAGRTGGADHGSHGGGVPGAETPGGRERRPGGSWRSRCATIR